MVLVYIKHLWVAYSRWPDKKTRDNAWPGENAPSEELPLEIRNAVLTIKDCLDPGRKMSRTIQSLNEDEFNILIKKMENYEGWHPWPEGEEYIPIQKIIAVKMINHKVTSYLILNPPEKQWLTREEAINLAEKQLLQAVVVHNKKQTYLRPFPHETPYRDLVC